MSVRSLLFRTWLLVALATLPLIAHAQVTGSPRASTTVPGVMTRDVTGGALTQGGSGPVDTNTVLRRPNSARAADAINALDYIQGGATQAQLQSGSADLAPTLNAAMAVGLTHIPCGTYVLNTLVTIAKNGSGFRGENKNCVFIYVNFATGDVVDVGSYSNAVTNPEVSGFTMVAGVTRTSGATIHEVNTHFADIHDFVIAGNHYTGVQIDGGPSQFSTKVQNFEVTGSSNADVLVANAAQDVFIESGTTSGGANGLLVTSVSGLYVFDVDAIGSGSGIHLSPSTTTGNASFSGSVMTAAAPSSGTWKLGQYVTAAGVPNAYILGFGTGSGGAGTYTLSASVGAPVASESVSALDTVSSLFFGNVLGDSSTYANWLFDGAGNIDDLHCSNCWGATSATDAGFAFRNPNLSGASFASSIALNNYGHGWDISEGKGISISASAAEYNSGAGSAQYSGFNVGLSADHVTVSASRSGAFGQIGRIPGQANNQAWGLVAGTGTSSQTIKVIGLDSMGNVTGTVQMPTGANVVNLGN